MPQYNLSELTEQELRQRLNSSRARGDAAVAYEILREMAARREARPERLPRLKRRKAAAHLVEVDLSDPMDRDEDDLPPLPAWRAPGTPPAPAKAIPETIPEAAEPIVLEAAPIAEDLAEPLTLHAPDPEPATGEESTIEDGLQLHPEALESLRPRRVRAGVAVGAGFAMGAAAGIAAGIAAGWFAWALPHEAASPAPVRVASQAHPARPAPAALDVKVADASPAAEPTTPSETVASTPTAPPEAAPAAEPSAPPTVLAEAADTAAAPAADAEPAPTLAAAGCATAPTPADREICADPALLRLQRELRRAYAQALDAHQDRALLRAHQLQWREARNSVSDPDRLARLYEQRIRKLHDATADARAQR